MLSLLLTLAAAAEPPDATAPDPRRDRGFALVELYTSEGCSSCPPADVVLSDLITEARRDDTAVYAIAFHVPWWDNGAWKDPYSDEAYGKRQRRYGDQLGLQTIYTPQVIINGRVEFVGSNAIKVRSAVARSLATPASATLSISGVSVAAGEPGVATVAVSAGGGLAGSVLHVALVEDGLGSQVAGGENRGKALRHDGVVRAMRTAPAEAEVSLSLPIPGDLAPENASVVAWLQRGEDLSIVAAHRTRWPQEAQGE